ncbi:oligosaccharide flippase family protein [Aquirufa antheringensis]
MDNYLKSNSVNSLRWASFGAVLPKIANPIISLSLINIIDAKEYGLLAIVSYIINFINIINGFGFNEFIIKESEISKLKLNSLFWANLIFSAVIFLLLLMSSPFISDLYNQPKLNDILPISAFILLINSIQLVNMSLLQKNLEFKKMFFLQIFPTIILFVVAYPLAILGFGVWSFVISQLLTGIMSLILYIYFTKWRPQIKFSKNATLEALHFGQWVTIEKVIEFVYSNVDLFFVSIYFDIKTVGIYSIARGLATVLFSSINGPFGQIMLPILAKLKTHDVGSVFLKISSRLYLINITLIIFVIIFYKNLLPFIFLNKYELIKLIPYVVLSEGISRCIWVQRDIYKIQNKPKKYLISIIPNLVYIITLLTLYKPQNLFVLLMIKLSNDIVYYIIQNYVFVRFANISFVLIVRLFYKLIFCGFISYLIYNLLHSYVLTENCLFTEVLNISLTIISYILLIYFIDRESYLKYKIDLLLILKI